MSGRGRGRGKKSKPRGRGRRIASFDEVIARNMEYERRENESEEGSEKGSDEEESAEKDGGNQGNRNRQYLMPPSDEEESDSEKEKGKISIADGVFVPRSNPNHNREAIEKTGIVELSRREREELERQKHERFMAKLDAEGKSKKAKADLIRLAEIRKKREEAARSRGEAKGNDDDSQLEKDMERLSLQ